MTANSPEPTQTSPVVTQATTGTRVRNFLIVLVAIVLTVSVFLGLKTETGSGLLSTLAEDAVPLEVALGNDKPTLVEFLR